MRKKLRANDDLRTRFRPSCKNKSLEVNDGIETLGVTRDGDFIVKQNRNPAVSKFHRAIQRNEPGRVRKSRRRGCETPLFTESFGTFAKPALMDPESVNRAIKAPLKLHSFTL